MHTYLENELIYPEVRRLLPELEDDVLESYEEHHVADVLCMELSAMSPDAERFEAKTTVLIENVTHHIAEEEAGLVPEGARRPRSQAVGRPRRPDAGAEEERTAQPGPAERAEEGGGRGPEVAGPAGGVGTRPGCPTAAVRSPTV